MKKYLPLIFLAILSGNLFSQTNFRFADSTAEWNVLREPFTCLAPPGSHCYETSIAKYEKDTVINSKEHQKVGGSYFYKDSLLRVFILLNDSDYLIYDFSKHAGDTIPGNDNSIPLMAVVDSVDTVFIGHARKRMFVAYSGVTGYSDIWIEGIGALYSNFLYPGGGALLADFGIDSLLCYSENNQVLYHLPTHQECVLDTVIIAGIQNVTARHISIWPNPSIKNFITIQSETNLPEQSTFQLFDITGRMVLQKQLSDKVNRVELNELAKGMFLYDIRPNEGKVASGKLVIQ